MNKDNRLLAEAYEDVSNKRDIRLFMGDPKRIVYFGEVDTRKEMLIQQTKKGVKFITAYVKPGIKGEYYYSLEPLPDISHGEFKDYQPALVPEEDIK